MSFFIHNRKFQNKRVQKSSKTNFQETKTTQFNNICVNAITRDNNEKKKKRFTELCEL